MSKLRTLGVTLLLVCSLVAIAAPGAVAQDSYDGERADLEIEQPPYVDEDVDVERASNATIYHVQGPTQTISFGNADAENVTDAGVLDGPGTITADASGETWTFNVEGAEATTAVYFDVETDDGSTRYVADIRASSVEWAHMPQEEYDEQREELSAWQDIKQDAESAVPGDDAVETIEAGLSYAAFFDSPTSAIRQDMQGTLIMMTMTPGGLVIFGSFIGVTVIMLARAYRYKNRTQKQLQELEEMDREKDEAWLEKAKQILQQCDFNDLLPDHTSRAVREYFGNNVWLFFKEYSLMRSPTSVKGTTLQMMAQTGYVGRVETDADGDVVAARAVKETDEVSSIPVADGGDDHEVRTIDLANLEYDNETDREIIEAIPADDLDERVFDQDIDASEVSFPVDNREVSDSQLIDALEPDFPGDFEDREQFARVLAELMQFVANHEYTDDEGEVRRERDLLSFLMEMDTILHDEADFPVAYTMQKELLYAAENMDKGERLNERIDSLELDGISRETTQIDLGAGGAST